MTFHHLTVLREESVDLLATRTDACVLDGTLGGGGHSELLLERGVRVIGLDRDEVALEAASRRLARFGDRFTPVHSDFRDARSVLDRLGLPGVDGLLVDLGVSSPQLDVAERGFSFSHDGPLDMRMDRSSGLPLADRLAQVDERTLAEVIDTYGEEPLARRFARAILAARSAGALTGTRALAEVVASATPAARWPRHHHPATRTFQALRIWVNDELGALESLLGALPSLILPGGRAAVIAFHSLEDRPVKKAFQRLATGCICPPGLPACGCGRVAAWRLVTRKSVTAGEAELDTNPRARSAHLRCLERLT